MVATCTLTVQRTPVGYLVQVQGRGTMRESPVVRAFVQAAVEDGAQVVLDLCRCDSLDSTFLGCLVLLQKRAAGSDGGFFFVRADSEARHRLMASNRLHLVLPLVEAQPQCLGEPIPLPAISVDDLQFGEHLLETHQQLADLGGPAAEAFRRVAECVKKELNYRAR